MQENDLEGLCIKLGQATLEVGRVDSKGSHLLAAGEAGCYGGRRRSGWLKEAVVWEAEECVRRREPQGGNSTRGDSGCSPALGSSMKKTC